MNEFAENTKAGASAAPDAEGEMDEPEWEWNFYIDYGNSGEDRKIYKDTELPEKIIVPFCPESRCSGVANKDFMSVVWYQKKLM